MVQRRASARSKPEHAKLSARVCDTGGRENRLGGEGGRAGLRARHTGVLEEGQPAVLTGEAVVASAGG